MIETLTTVRAATAADLDVIVEMAQRFLAATAYTHRIVDNAAQLRADAAFFLEAGGGFIALDGDRPIGMMLVTVFDHPLLHVRLGSEVVAWVEPEARASGIGKLLIAASEAFARGRGAVRMQLSSLRDARLERWYEHQGYKAHEVLFEKDLL